MPCDDDDDYIHELHSYWIHWQPGGRVGLPQWRVGFVFECCEGNPEGIPLKQQSKNIEHKQISVGKG